MSSQEGDLIRKRWQCLARYMGIRSQIANVVAAKITGNQFLSIQITVPLGIMPLLLPSVPSLLTHLPLQFLAATELVKMHVEQNP